MLLCQQGCGTQDGDLLAVHDGNESRTQRHLGFAETHVAANKAIHGTARVHIGNDSRNGRGLIGRFFKSKTFAECLIIRRFCFKCKALLGFAHGVKV